MVLIVVLGANDNRDRELYYLKNLKFLADNPNAVISEKNDLGDLYIKYHKGSLRKVVQ